MTLRGAAPALRDAIVMRGAIASIVAAFGLVTPVASTSAQAACTISTASGTAARRWPAPLDREVTLFGDKVTLRDGLTQLAAAARVRLSYVAELLPLDRQMCLAYQSVPAGNVLSDLLRGTELEPVVAGDDQVVLAPVRHTTSTESPTDAINARRASVLDRVVVVGVSSNNAQRSVPISLDVVSRDKLAHEDNGSLAHLLDGNVPGVWMWQQSPTTLLARYGSIRGASSFGVSYPKIYIDGIEVANPLIVQQFDPSTIERVEVIRGPQGAALYGADANSGVINIVTRHDGTGPDGQRLQLASTAGMTASQFAPQGVLTQQHSLAFHAGTAERSAGLGVSLNTLGAYVPGAFARTIAANGSVRVVGEKTVLSGTARLFTERAGSPANPLLSGLTGGPEPGPLARHDGSPGGPGYSQWGSDPRQTAPMQTDGRSFPSDTGKTQSVSQYTVGGNVVWAPNERWTHTLVLGVDGYRLANPAVDDGPIPSATDSALVASRGGGDRVTARLTSAAHFGSADRTAAVLTFTAEHAAVREETAVLSVSGQGGDYVPRPGEPAGGSEARLIGWRGNSGLVAQANTSMQNHVFLTAGLRLERDDALLGSTRVSSLPVLGGAVVGDRGDVTLKLRAAYGKGVRPVQGAIRELGWSGRRATLVAYDVTPEQQAGTEAGADLLVGRTLGFHVTRFDQKATGLVQSVPISVPDRASPRGARFDDDDDGESYIAYELQNVGEIANRGWEITNTVDFGRLSLGGSLSLVDSRVQRVAAGYTGDMQPGDRMLEVPARTAGVSGSWQGKGWFSSLTLTRASDWTGYDRVAVAQALTTGGLRPRDLVGDRLRSYWREYAGATRLRASYSRDLFRGLSLMLTGDNLLGQQRGEPDNATIVPGRTVTAGLKAKF
jgi:iron complex outermembrane receptor protein